MKSYFNNQKGTGLVPLLMLLILVLGVFILRDPITKLLNPSTPNQSLTYNSEMNEEEDEEEDDDALDVEEFPDE